MMRRWLMVLAVLGVGATSGLAQAQEIQLTGPLAGAPAVRKLRLRRRNRVELAPMANFTLLDEFQRTIILGGRLNYNPTDWLGIGVWGGAGVIRMPQPLTDHITEVTVTRRAAEGAENDINVKLTEASISRNGFKNQLGKIDWVVAPQLTLVPFRGKLAIFQKIFVDTDAYIFAGPAFVGLTERENCESCGGAFNMKSRTAITATFGLGLTFYMGKWASLGVEWRGLPFAWNTGGFDTRGGDPEQRFPDTKITDKDRDFRMNMMVGVSLGIYFPTTIKQSE